MLHPAGLYLMMFLEVYSVFVSLSWFGLMLWLIINGRKILYLSALPHVRAERYPSVAVIIAVRNEEYGVKAALTSVCNLNYPNYHIIVVNDRSTDATATILSEVQASHPDITVLTIDTLPSGWLGKNHALYKGYQSADADYLLFTDADVLYDKDVLDKAMQYSLQHHLDHLTILPGIISKSDVLSSVVMTFIVMLTTVQRPWAARKSRSKASMGVGAFNLVRKTAYERAGTHQVIKMRPDDDLKLGAILKSSGAKADVLYGTGKLQVEWYSSLNEFIKGLMKNAFSGFDYNVFKALGGTVGTFLFLILPLPLMLLSGNSIAILCAIGILLCQILLYWTMPGATGKWWHGLLSIYGGLVMLYVIVKATYTSLKAGGIYWRDTFYSLDELRKK